MRSGWNSSTEKDLCDEELARYDGVTTTTVRRALLDVHTSMPPDWWRALLDEALRRELLDDTEARELAEQADENHVTPQHAGAGG